MNNKHTMSSDDEVLLRKKAMAAERRRRYYLKHRERIIAHVMETRDHEKKLAYDRERYQKLKGTGQWKKPNPPSEETIAKNRSTSLAWYHANKEAIAQRRKEKRAMAKAQSQ